MIVCLDTERQIATVCDKSIQEIPFSNMHLLSAILKGKQVTYVVSAIEATGDSVLEMISSLSGQPISISTNNDGPFYVRSILKGCMNVTDIGIQFKGPYDLKPLSKLGADIFERSLFMKSLLKDGKIEVLSARQAKELLESRQRTISPRDQSLDTILVPVDKPAKSVRGEDIFSDDIDGNDAEPLSENEKILKQLNG
jgi:hypothetical protein